MRRILALMLSVVALATFLYSCGKASSPAEKQEERKGRGQAETTAHEPTAPTSASGGASEGMSGKEQAARSEADCRLVLYYVAHENMSRKESTVFSELLADMIRTMESPSWTGGDLRNAALDHLAVPRYPECKARDK